MRPHTSLKGDATGLRVGRVGRAALALLAFGALWMPALLAFAPLARAAWLAGPALSVDAGANRHAISSDIYGVTMWYNNDSTVANDLAFAKAIRLPLNRHGGDATSRYNWQVDASNAGADWYYMAGNGQSAPTPSGSVDALIDHNRSTGTRSVITVPIIEYINKSSAWNCSYPQSKYNGQQSYNPYVHPNGDNCGNGRYASDGKFISDTSPSNPGATDISNSPDIQKAWVQHLVGKYGSAANGGVPIYELDNEPSGWLAMHNDVHPQGVGYTELLNQSTAYAAAIKSADPSAAVLGPGDIPFAYMDCNNCGNDGASAHGGVPFGKWYLQQMAAYQQQHGVRILDYYSMHYPGAGGDPIATTLDRIHTFQGYINEAYPGTKLGFDEYNYGDAKQFSNALTEADALGLFGREGVNLASYWGLDDTNSPTAYIFRMYRNYDGAGGAFGETSVSASSGAAGQLAIYAATRKSDGALTLMVINKTGGDLTSPLALANFAPSGPAQVYTYSAANPGAISHQPGVSVSGGGFTTTYPANSVTLIALPSAANAVAATNPTATANATPSVTATASATATANASATGANASGKGGKRAQASGAAPVALGGAAFALLASGGGASYWWFFWRRRRRRDGRQAVFAPDGLAPANDTIGMEGLAGGYADGDGYESYGGDGYPPDAPPVRRQFQSFGPPRSASRLTNPPDAWGEPWDEPHAGADRLDDLGQGASARRPQPPNARRPW